MVEFASGVKGIALNLENENVGIGNPLTSFMPLCYGPYAVKKVRRAKIPFEVT